MIHPSPRRPDVFARPIGDNLEGMILAEVGSDTCQCSNESPRPFEQVCFRVESLRDVSRLSNRENTMESSGGKLTQWSWHRAFEEYHRWVRGSLIQISSSFDCLNGNFLRFLELFFFEGEM